MESFWRCIEQRTLEIFSEFDWKERSRSCGGRSRKKWGKEDEKSGSTRDRREEERGREREREGGQMMHWKTFSSSEGRVLALRLTCELSCVTSISKYSGVTRYLKVSVTPSSLLQWLPSDRFWCSYQVVIHPLLHPPHPPCFALPLYFGCLVSLSPFHCFYFKTLGWIVGYVFYSNLFKTSHVQRKRG